MTWLVLNAAPLLNIIGLLSDIGGTFLVASEVVHQFRGKQYGASFTFDEGISLPPVETEEYKKWSHLKTRNMKVGMVLLTAGFILQVIGNALQLGPR